MTPQDSLGMPSSPSGASNNMYNSISAQGMGGNPTEQGMQEPQQESGGNPAEQAIAQFKQAFDSVQSLLENPQFAVAQQEADLVKRSLQNWLETVVTSLSNTSAGQEQGGESLPQMAGATPPSSSSPSPQSIPPSQSGAGY